MASHQINIRLSQEEHARVVALSAASGLPPATWVKAKLLSAIEGDEIRSMLEMMMARQAAFDEHLLSRVNAILQATLDNISPEVPQRTEEELSSQRSRIKNLVEKGRDAAAKFMEQNLSGE